MIEFRLLGQFSVRRDNSPVEIRSRPAQTLLAYLLLTPNSSHRREKLAGLLWPDATDANSRSYLRKALWQMRKSLPPQHGGGDDYFSADDISIAFNASSEYWLDAAVVGAALAEGAPMEDLIEAVSTYQGELLPGFYEEWVALERDRLKSAFEQKMNVLIAQLLEHGRWAQIVEWAERWIALGEAPEPAYRALMMAHANTGDMAKVAVVYARCVEALHKDLGVKPSKQTQALYARSLRGEGTSAAEHLDEMAFAAAWAEGGPVSEARAVADVRLGWTDAPREALHNLPAELSSFVGRLREKAEVHQLLESGRLVTLTGPGGCGKTRLALQVAAGLLDEYSDGVWLVELASLSEPALVPQEVSLALGLREAQDRHPTRVLLDHLRTKQILLVFDNCEHLIEACAELAETLERGCPRIRILATSREALGVTGEIAWIVPSLTMPELDELIPFETLMEYDAIRLFVERAKAARNAPAFALTEENSPSVIRICRRLDGIPLAVELAAARLKALTLEQVTTRLDDRFSLLTTGSRTALARHQTLRATMDWSYDLLAKNEQAMLRQLSAFAGGWTLEGAETICRPLPGSFLPDSGKATIEGSDVLDMLSNLLEKSLIVVEQQDAIARYRMLETIREYAREKLKEHAEDSAVRDRHLEIFVQLAEQIEPMLHGDQVIWFDRLEMELDNIRDAIEWAMGSGSDGNSQQFESRVEAGLRLAGALGWFFEKRNRTEPLDRLMQLLAQPKAAEQTKWRAKALNAAGFLNLTVGNYPEAKRVLEEALVIGRKLKDKWSISWALDFLGAVADFQGNYDTAEAYLKEGLALSREMGTEGNFAAGWSLTFLGDLFLYRENLEQAQSLYEESVVLLRDLKNQSMLAYSARRLGHLALRKGEAERATALFKESLLLNREVDHRQGVASCLAAFAKVAAVSGNMIRAAQLSGASDALLTEVATPLYQPDRIEHDLNMEIVRSELDDAAVAAAWTEGHAMSLEQAVALALGPSGATDRTKRR